MMTGLSVYYDEFVTTVRMSHEPYILLEGAQDERFFRTLYQDLYENPKDAASKVSIVSAQSIRSGDHTAGNREKVEIIADLMSNRTFKGRFVAFVDREFRGFRFDNRITDSLSKQNLIDRLVWSRGHSIENYMLDVDVVKTPLLDHSLNTVTAEKALNKLQYNFQLVLANAWAIGLAAAKLNCLDVARGSINWNVLEFDGSSLKLDVDRWKNTLDKHTKLTPEESLALVDQFESYLSITTSSGIDEVRWACDGHLGMRFVWVAYAKLIFEIRNSEPDGGPIAKNQRDAILHVVENIRFNLCARNWIRVDASKVVDTPKECFVMLGFTEC